MASQEAAAAERFVADYQRNAAHLARHGLYDPADEHAACGVGFVAAIDGQPRRQVVEAAIDALRAVWHRGAVDADGKTGDGAGIYLEIPQNFFREQLHSDKDVSGRLAVGMVFLPRTDFAGQERCRTIVETEILGFGYAILGWRQVPVDTSVIGEKAIATRPEIEQIIVGNAKDVGDDEFERELFLIRRRIEKQVLAEHIKGFYVCRCPAGRSSTRGCFWPNSCRCFIPTCRSPASSPASRCSISAVDQHLAVVAAGAAVPHARAQRRDQYAARQPELDEEPRDPHGGAGVRRVQRAR